MFPSSKKLIDDACAFESHDTLFSAANNNLY